MSCIGGASIRCYIQTMENLLPFLKEWVRLFCTDWAGGGGGLSEVYY